MNKTDLGKISEKFWLEIPNHFTNSKLDEYVIMPNHIHGIIIIQNSGRDVLNHVSTNKFHSNITPMGKHTLGEIIRLFKGATTFEIHISKPNFSWQSRYYDHIIRNNQSLNIIRWYIRNNHLKWNEDEENPKNH